MRQPKTILERGVRVSVTELQPVDGFFIAPKHMTVRKSGISGEIMMPVAGHGGDVYFVKHDDTEDVGAYCFTEFELVK